MSCFDGDGAKYKELLPGSSAVAALVFGFTW